MKKSMNIKDIVISLIQSIDNINFLLKDHHKRVAIIAYAIGCEMNLTDTQTRRLVLAASLHDIGALYVKERKELIDIDTINPIEHAVRGSFLLKKFDCFEEISTIVLHHHRLWKNGSGSHFKENEVPIESFVLHLADRIEVLLDATEHYVGQKQEILNEIYYRSGAMFHPDCVSAFATIADHESFWLNIGQQSLEELLNQALQNSIPIKFSLDKLETLTEVFSNIVDYRSQFTATHSKGVGEVAYMIGKLNKCSEDKCKELRLAGYLHDIGKIGIATEILDKPEILTTNEKDIMKTHAYYTNYILNKVTGMEDICKWASMHHERRDGSGYPFHKLDFDFSFESDIIALSDIFTALSEHRPYRSALPEEQIRTILFEEFEKCFDETIFYSLINNIGLLNDIRSKVQNQAYESYQNTVKAVSEYVNLKAMSL